VHWSLYLGDKFQPYKVAKVPLFLLRGTSFYQWESQAAAVFDIKAFSLFPCSRLNHSGF
jgi:hypothetical protein